MRTHKILSILLPSAAVRFSDDPLRYVLFDQDSGSPSSIKIGVGWN